MKCEDFENIGLENDFGMKPKKPDPIWGDVAFIVTKPWPTVVCVPDYDTGEPEMKDGHRVVEFEVENGCATYEVLGDCEYGVCYHCKLLKSQYTPHKKAA